jgi:hypothetical protein
MNARGCHLANHTCDLLSKGGNNKTAGEPERLRFKPGQERLYCLNARGAPAGKAEKTINSLIKDTSDKIMVNYRG